MGEACAESWRSGKRRPEVGAHPTGRKQSVLRGRGKVCKILQLFWIDKNFKIFISIATTVLLVFMLDRHVTSLAQKCKRQEKERKRKVKVEGTVLILILPSAHARTSKALIWHQQQKAAYCLINIWYTCTGWVFFFFKIVTRNIAGFSPTFPWGSGLNSGILD